MFEVAKVFSMGGRGRLKRVVFDGSHAGRSDPGPPEEQITLSLGGTHEGSEVPMMGPDSGGARSRHSDTRIPPGKPGGDVGG